MTFSSKVMVSPPKGFIIHVKGPIDIDHFYKNAPPWFDRYKYDFTESEQIEKNFPQGNEIIMGWLGERKINDYVQYTIEVKILIIGVKKVGNIYHGEIKINLISHVDLDYAEQFQKNPFTKFLFYIYNNFIFKKKIIEHLNKLEKETLDFNDLIKSLLKHYR
ncbi:hypothetical protein CL617_02375 [archaeon]|nr:hypothetical protein [archaeon]|tara:strand:- start:17915 stop:18400 length:486 start_codon:yes stop_codon:yes gene_type:complete